MKHINIYITEKIRITRNDGKFYEPKYKSGFVSQFKRKQMSDEELLFEYWAQWSGWNDGKSGLSSNPRATKLSNEIYNKYDYSDYYADPCNKIMKLNDIVEQKFNVSAGSRMILQNGNVGNYMKQLIKDNLGWLLCGEREDDYEIIK